MDPPRPWWPPTQTSKMSPTVPFGTHSGRCNRLQLGIGDRRRRRRREVVIIKFSYCETRLLLGLFCCLPRFGPCELWDFGEPNVRFEPPPRASTSSRWRRFDWALMANKITTNEMESVLETEFRVAIGLTLLLIPLLLCLAWRRRRLCVESGAKISNRKPTAANMFS